MRVLVCGGREYDNYAEVERVLTALHHDHKFSVVIHGCARGADTLADCWALNHEVATIGFPAEWKQLGKAAGPIRNALMLTDGEPDLVVAFHGGRGTGNMVSLARKAGIRVVEVAPVE